MDEKMKKELERLINTSKINAEVIGIVTRMKTEKFTDMDMIATGILLSKMIKQRMGK
jgi:hypothetical protein